MASRLVSSLMGKVRGIMSGGFDETDYYVTVSGDYVVVSGDFVVL